MKLSELKTGQVATIVAVEGHGEFRRRITEMGFVRGKKVIVVKNAPLLDPIEYNIMGYEVSLRRDEACLLEVENVEYLSDFNAPHHQHVTIDQQQIDQLKKTPIAHHHPLSETIIKVALVGNPNSGKTTLFNAISGLNQHTGNYSGVTVDATKAAVEFAGYTIEITDLPGTYSISPFSPEERFVRDHIALSRPDVVINVIDGSNIERNLYLTTQLIDMEQVAVLAMNMYDEFLESGDKLDKRTMGELLGMPIVPTVGKRGRGVAHILQNIVKVYTAQQEIEQEGESERELPKVSYPIEVERLIEVVGQKIEAHQEQQKLSTQNALQDSLSDIQDNLIGNPQDNIESDTQNNLAKNPQTQAGQGQKQGHAVRSEANITPLSKHSTAHKNPATLPYSKRYTAIKLIEGQSDMLPREEFHEVYTIVEKGVKAIEQTYALDIETLMTDSRYGFISGAMKESYTYANRSFHTRSTQIDRVLTHRLFGLPIFVFLLWVVFYSTFTLGQYPMEWIGMGVDYIKQLVEGMMSDGALKNLIGSGVIDGVGSVIVFLPNIIILFLFISFMEDTGYMARAAFITDKLMHKIGLHGKSFIPMIMGFGCGVPAIMATRTIENKQNRLQTMLLIPFMSCSARLPVYILVAGTFFPQNAGNVLFAMYLGGIVLAIVSSLLMKKVFFKGKDVNFVMELPPYRIPTLQSTVKHVWHKAKDYLSKMGGVILIAVVIIWALGYYPNHDSRIAARVSADSITVVDGSVESSDSYLSMIGKSIEPAIAPLGFDWKMGIGLLSGIAAKEVIVSSMGVIYQTPENDESALGPRLAQDIRADGTPVWNSAVAISFLTFVLIYFPCVAAITAIRRESGAWRWALFTVFYTTALAWIVSFVVYNLALLFIE